ncbi:MAG: zinc-binding alcohol dehydrogenase [Chloroflexota bacterium]
MVTVQAVVIPEPHKVGLQAVNIREAQANEVVIDTAYTSISAGTERMLLAGQMPHPMLQLPVVPGYETVGHVVSVGADVSPDLVGTAVYVGGAHCYDDVNPAWGGQSARLVASADKVVPLNGVDPRQGVLLALSATALHGVDVLNPAENDRVLVIGQGPVGQLAGRIVRQRGAWVAVSDLNSQRLERSVGDEIINVAETDLSEVITEPVNAIIEASGSMQALASALPHLANGGTILLLGYYSTLDLPYMPLFLKEAKVLTAKEWGATDLQRSRDMIADGSLEVASLLTHEMPIQEVTAGYDIAMNDASCLKLVLDWSAL